MREGPRQLLVVLDLARAEEAQTELRRHFDVSDVASSRVLVAWDKGNQVAAIRGVVGVAWVGAEEIPTGVLESLDEGERLFARAWEERQRSTPKERKGEGMSWDSTGLTPPDKPR
jgi:hypothetical protein